MKRLFLLVLLPLSLSFNAAAEGFLKGKILKLDSDKPIAERNENSFGFSMSGFSMSSSLSLLSVERAIQKAATDKDIAMIYINTDHFSAPLSAMEEIRACLRKFRESGKPVVTYGASIGNGPYYLASVADRVFINPKTDGSLTGLGSMQFFLKDLIDTLGVDVQLIRHGKFKSAGEMYIRNDISPENRLQYEEMLSSLWSTMVEEMAESRGVSADSLNAWTNSLALSSAQSWLDKGLVDGLKYRDEMEQYLCHLFGTTDPRDLKKVSLGSYVSDLKKGPSTKKVAVIYADGEIVRSSGDIVGEALAREIAKVRADSTVKAVVFRVNSPGGEVVAAEIIRREIELLQKVKPVVASYGSYAASGGYLISAGCDRIFVDNTTLTGSIGVFGLIPSFGRAVRKNLHVNMVSVGTSEHSTMGNGVNPLNAKEEAWYQGTIEKIYDDFVTVVSDGRKLTKDYVDSIAQGRVWAGKDALKIGLADEKGSLADAIEYAAGKAGLKKYRIAGYPSEKDFMQTLKSADKKKKDDDIIRIDNIIRPGFNTIARMPSISLRY